MAVTETQRHDLHTHFQETMGHERAAVLMELLPPVGWGDVATKQDLHAAVERLEITMATGEDLANLKADILDKMNTQMLAMIGANITLYGLSFGLLTLLR